LMGARDCRAFAIQKEQYLLPEVSPTFHGRDILAPVAARLASGLPTAAVGPAVEDSLELFRISRPVSGEAGLEAHVIHVDRFGNLVTDLSEAGLLTWQRERGSERVIVQVANSAIEGRVIVQVANSAIEGTSLTYAGAHPGELIALFGSTGRLEIAVSMGSAAECLGVGRGAIVLVEGRP